VRWLRFAVGLLIALTLHSLLDSFFPNALAFFNPYVILVVYYSMGGNVFGAIIAGVIAGLVLTVWVIVRWIADTRRDIAELPLHHDGEHH